MAVKQTIVAVVDAKTIFDQSEKRKGLIDDWHNSNEYKSLSSAKNKAYTELQKVWVTVARRYRELPFGGRFETEEGKVCNKAEAHFNALDSKFKNRNKAMVDKINLNASNLIQNIITEFVKDNGIGLLLHPNAELLSYTDDVDITPEVLEIYNKKANEIVPEVKQHNSCALNFNGNAQYLQLGDLPGTTELTAEFLVKVPTNLNKGQHVGTLLGNYSPGTTDYFGFEIFNQGQARVYWYGIDLYGSTDLRDGKTHHIAFVRNKSEKTWKIFVDGTIDGVLQDCGKDLIPKLPFRAGTDNRTAGCPYFHGEIGEIRIWTKARTEIEIINTMNSLLNGSENKLFTYYKINEGSGNTLTDATANGNNAILINAPSWITR